MLVKFRMAKGRTTLQRRKTGVGKVCKNKGALLSISSTTHNRQRPRKKVNILEFFFSRYSTNSTHSIDKHNQRIFQKSGDSFSIFKKGQESPFSLPPAASCAPLLLRPCKLLQYYELALKIFSGQVSFLRTNISTNKHAL